MTSAARAEGRLTVLYDARCRVCTRIAARFAALDRGRRLRIRPLQWAHDDEWASVRRLRAERDLRSALHVVDEIPRLPSGKVLRRVLRDRFG